MLDAVTDRRANLVREVEQQTIRYREECGHLALTQAEQVSDVSSFVVPPLPLILCHSHLCVVPFFHFHFDLMEDFLFSCFFFIVASFLFPILLLRTQKDSFYWIYLAFFCILIVSFFSVVRFLSLISIFFLDAFLVLFLFFPRFLSCSFSLFPRTY